MPFTGPATPAPPYTCACLSSASCRLPIDSWTESMAIVVDSINAQTRWSIAHVMAEAIERFAPSSTHLDASSAIVFVLWVVFVVAPV